MTHQHAWDVPVVQHFPKLEALRVPEPGYGLGLEVGLLQSNIGAYLAQRVCSCLYNSWWSGMREVLLQTCFCEW